ncbi:lipase secretion chaperone [Sinimarinibacterium thermocellulolyticum]|uniref:Lipase chaperone n=1 Tax=Sinimarinibacterium thermocellulolyticum TaxID=3170016 RepID=A0ABV2A5U1_9GAMM
MRTSRLGMAMVGALIGAALIVLRDEPERSAPQTAPAPQPAQWPPAPSLPTAPDTGAPLTHDAPAASAHAVEDAADDAVPFAASLVGTEVDGYFETGPNGELRVTRRTRDLFDYFLATHGERSLEEIVAEIRRRADATLPADAARQAHDLLDRYIAYKQSAQTYLSQSVDPAQSIDWYQTAEQVFRTLVERRRQSFSTDEIEAFFGAEERYGEYALQRLRIETDDQLTDAQRTARLAALEAAAPAEIREVRERAVGHLEREAVVARMRAAGAGDAQILRYREAHVGADEARRLAELDARYADWERRYARYAAERDAMLATPPCDSAAGAQALQDLRRAYFSGEEIERARVSDSLLCQTGTRG